MRSFFVQIFLSFWITILLTFVLTAVIFPSAFHAPPETMRFALATSLERMARAEMDRGPMSCKPSAKPTFFILDAQNGDVCGQTAPKPVLDLVNQVRRSDRQMYSAFGSQSVVAQQVTVAGATYVAVLLAPRPAPEWFPHLPPWSLPVSAIVTFAFAYLLTKPVRALRSAFRRFAAGDMRVRVPVPRTALRDWGGADVRTLMIDFNDLADRIQALLEAHKILLRDVSHELRSPLARLNVALELAREEAPEAKIALDRAELESSRLNALIGELLSLSSMEALHNVPQQALLSLSDLVDEIMPDLKFEAEARGCDIDHRNGATCPVLGSRDLLRRALENVIRNAIRYSPAQTKVIVESLEDKGRSVVRVYDAGPGVPEESLTAIFRPFYRTDSARQSSTGGFGVGLAIADRAIQIHSGAIRAFNRNNGGLCVELSLPCSRQGFASI